MANPFNTHGGPFRRGGRPYPGGPSAPAPRPPLSTNPFNTHGGPFRRFGPKWYLNGPPKAPGGGTDTATGAPYVTPPPDESYKDSNYYGTDSQITQGLNNLRPYLINQAQGLGAEYGVDTANSDPTTYDPAHPTQFNIDWANVDTNNPFSRAALLKKSFQQQSRGDTNRMAAAGQLYAGAEQNAQNNDQSQYTQGQNTLLTDFASKFGGLYGQWQNAQTTATGQRIANTGNAINAHINDPVAAPQTQTILKDQVAGSGVTFAVVDGKLVFKDSKGNVINGARLFVKGGKSGITVPK